MRLNKKDFDLLDDLLGKIGFGGYYDLVECLKMVAEEIFDDEVKKTIKINEINDLNEITSLLLAFKKKRRNKK